MDYNKKDSYISRRKFLKCSAVAAAYGLMKITEPVFSVTEEISDYPSWGFPRIATFEEITGVNNPGTEMFQYFNNPTFLFPVALATAATMLKDKNYKIYYSDGNPIDIHF